VLDSLIAAGSSFQMVGAVKLKERLKLVVHEGIHKFVTSIKVINNVLFVDLI